MSPDRPAARLLVVDDNPVDRAVVVRLLSVDGYDVEEAANGRLALDLLDADGFDVVLTDLLMPELDGFGLLAAIKSDDRHRHVPVIVVTGRDDLDSAVRCIELGATDYVLRPFKPALLLARVRASLGEKHLRDLEREHLDRQEALNEILKIIGRSTFDLQAVLDAIVTTAARLGNGDNAVIYLADGELFRSRAAHGRATLAVSWEAERPHTKGRDTIVGRVMISEQIEEIVDVLADPDYHWDAQEIIGYRSLLGVPIRSDGGLVGCLVVARNQVDPFTPADIALVSAFAEQVSIAIENARLVETIERQKGELTRFISPQIADLITSTEGEELLAGHRRRITVVYTDLRGFTSFSETAEPEEVLGVLRAYHATLGRIIVEHDGTLEHFAGDGVMVYFNDPVLQPDHEERAVRMALAMRDAVAELAHGWRRLGYELGFGVGIVAGYATLGRIGFEGRYDYGAVGNAVNLAARLCAEAAPGQILLDQRTLAAVEERIESESIGELALKGLTRPVPAFNVRAFRESVLEATASEG